MWTRKQPPEYGLTCLVYLVIRLHNLFDYAVAR